VLTLAALPWTAALRAPDAPALRTTGAAPATLSFRQLDNAAAGVAARLRRRGIVPGDRVAICSGNGLAFPALYYGALRAEAVVVLLPTTAPVADLAATIRRLRVALVASDHDHAAITRAALRHAGTGAAHLTLRDDGPATARTELGLDALTDHPAAAPPSVPPAAPAVILNTSGTTGTPRHALHSHVGLLLNARAVAGEMLHLDERDVQLGALPLPHSFGMSAVLNASMVAGASVVLMSRFDASRALEVIDEQGVTVLQAVPTMFSRLVATAAASAAAARPASLRLTVVSGAPLPVDLAAQVHRRLCDRIVERYGMTEVSPLTMREVPAGGGEPGDVGRPLWGAVVRVVGGGGSGELEATAPSMFLGYAGSHRATQEALRDGFFRTGDLGRVDQDGRVVLTGRLKDLIIRGGYNVPAREVEQALESHPDVAEVAVVGLPDADLGEEVAAALVLRGNGRHAEATAAELRARCAQLLAAYKRPRRWYVLAELPRTASGKVRKHDLRDALAEATPVLSERQ
jgi:long-chain acyl-CoA synthetase